MLQSRIALANTRRPMLISRAWVQATALVMVFGFFVMGLLAYRTYTDSMPQPARVVAESGSEVFTSQDITSGQQLFLRRGLMEYGSIVGHGGYLGPDYTADYLRRSAELILSDMEAAGVNDPRTALVAELRTNRYDARTGVLTWTARQAAAFETIRRHYAAGEGLS